MANDQDEQSFRQMWIEAETRFGETTKKSLVQSNNQSLNDVLKKLDQWFDPQDPEEGGRQQRIKELATNVLKLIQLLGGIAAQGASLVFGPANLCFNAMAFLINIPAKISKFYDELALLFEEISAFMQSFKIYQRIEQYAKVDVELKQSTHKLMILFVDICAISIDVLSGSRLKRAKIGAKIALFDNDSGIQTKLDEFKRLVDHQSQVSDAITLEHVLKSEHELTNSMKNVFKELKQTSENSRQLLNAKSQEIQDELKGAHDEIRTVNARTETLLQYASASSGKEKQHELVDKICGKLLINPDLLQESERELDQKRIETLPGTGGWLTDVDVYKAWINLESENDPQLLVSGSSGSGKSCLAFAILNDMKSRYNIASNSPMRVLSAFYRFVKNEKPSRDGFQDSAIKESLKFMAAQMANQNTVYLRKLHSLLEAQDLSPSKERDVKDLFEELIPPPNVKDTPDIAYVLLFDGLDQLSDDEAYELFRAILSLNPSRIRIILTGTEEVFHSCSSFLGRSLDSVSNIRVEDHNKSDIKHFIDRELETGKILQRNVPEILRIKKAIREKLPDIAKGNFNDARQIIGTIGEAVDAEQPGDEIMKLISADTLKNKDAATEKLIRELNHLLNAQEVEQLNDLLIWTIYAFEYMSVDQLQAALFLRTKRTPLQGLEDKVAQKYSRLLEIDQNSIIDMRSNYLADFFRNSKRQNRQIDVEGDHDPKISMTITIDHVKLSKVQRFFWDLSEKVVLDKFAFTASLTSPEQTTVISANSPEAHLTLTRRCFDLLLEDPHEKTKILGPYALMNLPMHLLVLRGDVKDSSLNHTEMEDIVDGLVSLLQSAGCIEKHLTEDFFLRGAWLDEGSEIRAIEAWLCDSQATGKLGRKGRSWLKQVSLGGRLGALKEVATMIARQWLCDRTWSAELPYQWIDVYLDRLADCREQELKVDKPQSGGGSPDSSDQDGADEKPDDHPAKEAMSNCERVQRAAKWAENEAKITKDSLWYERLGLTYLSIKEIGLSKEAFLTAKGAPSSSWKISEGLAEAYAMSDQKDFAVQEMESIFSQLRGKEGLTTNERADLIKDLIKSAKWQIELRDITYAIDRLQEAIRLDEHNYKSHYEVLKVFIDTDQESEAMKVLSGMATQPAKDNLTQLGSMLLEFSEWEDSLTCFETIIHATRQHDMFHVILQTLQNVLNHARGRNAIPNQMDLLLCQGVALVRYSKEENRLESALRGWEECCKLWSDSKNREKRVNVLSAVKYIFNYYFSVARSTRNASNDLETHMNKIEELSKNTSIPYAKEMLRPSIGSFYTLSGKQDVAQKLLLDDMKSGLGLLSDDDPENDSIGYSIIANVLLHTGDDINALSAWSLIGPGERYDQEFMPSRICDGRCNEPFTWGDSIWFCKVCEDVQFHDDCLEKLKKGTLARFVCSPDHEWLSVPSWVDEYRATGRGRVRAGGELQDGKRIGGQIVAVEEWLDMIREKWGIKKTSEVRSEDEKQKSEMEA